MTPTLKYLPLSEVRPSKTNPRKDFSSDSAMAYLEELARTITQHGVKQPALVRPSYCVGARSRAEITERLAAAPVVLAWHELVFGECRWRASAIAKAETLPCIVEELTDDDAREVQQIENLTRRDLTPIEEAQGYSEMLSLKNDDGSARYTATTLAAKLGRSADWIWKRLALLALGEEARQAMLSGVLTAKVASLIATVPEPAQRAEFAAKILHPDLEEGPLSWQRARSLRDDKYAKSLKGVIFSLSDAALVPAAGACAACPKLAANRPELFEGDESAAWKQNTCLDPACYRAKIAAHQQRFIDEQAKQGKKALSAEECAKIYPFYTTNGEMDPKSPYVQTGRKPAEHLLKKEVLKVPTWEVLVAEAEKKTGAKVPRVLIADQEGAVREHVELKLAIAAIEKAGEPIFRTEGERPAKAPDSFAVDRKAEQERAKAKWAVASASLDAVWAALLKDWDSPAVWDALFFIAMAHAGEAGQAVLVKWRGLTVGDGEFANADAIEKWWHGLKVEERDAVIPLLLVAGGLKNEGTGDEDFLDLARALKVDLATVEKKAVGDFKAKEASARLKPAELKEKIRGMVRDKVTPAGIAVALGLSMLKVDRVLKALENEERAAKLTTDPKTLAEWVKADASGMPIEEIARSYKVAAADVKGALSAKKSEGLKPGKRQAIVTLLVAGKDKAAIAKQLGVSLPAVHTVAKQEKLAEAEAAAPEKPTAKPKPATVEAEARVRELRAQGRTFTDIFIVTKMPQRKLKKILADIDAEKAKAVTKGGAGK